ncbi:MAG: glycosyltransferase family 4 protein [Verrucomicrobiales bacterium]|nr:glycosyltransferase family 4 protein [Verrucomicrobiales bacterium]
MQVAIVIHDFLPDNGQGRYAIEISRRLAGRCAMHVYANRLPEQPPAGVTCHRVPAYRPRYALAIASFLVASEPQLRRQPRLLIHAQGLTCWSADIATVHVCNAARARTLAPADRGSWWFSRCIMPLEARFYRQQRLRHVITMSHRLAREVAQFYQWSKPVSVIPHGTDTTLFRPVRDEIERRTLRSELGVPPTSWCWLFVGEAVKGLATAIDVLPRFPHAHLIVVSRSDPRPYQQQAERLGVLGRIQFRGFDPETPRVYRAADVLVYPTQYESFGMVVAEAMASALPVIVGREAGVAELIEDQTTGLLVPADNPDALTAKLRLLAHDAPFARALGSAARATIERHSWDRCAEATWEAYQAAWSAKSLASNSTSRA